MNARARRALQQRIEDLSGRFLGQRDAGLQEAIDRSGRWLAALFEAGAGERLMRCRAYADFFEAAGSPQVVRLVGEPAPSEVLASVERDLGFALPDTLRRLLGEVGGVAFMDRQVVGGRELCPPTFDATELAPAFRRFEAWLGPLTEGYGDRYAELRDVYRVWEPDWQRWRPGQGGVFDPEAMAQPCFLPICPYYSEGAHLMALHLGDSHDAPVFLGGGNDEPYFFVAAGEGLDGWLSRMVDRVIEEVTTSLSAVLTD